MKKIALHTFHIPVMGLGYTIDTPIKTGRFGISSVISIIEDELVEQMRQYHAESSGRPFTPIAKTDQDHRAKRITAYLNLVDELLKEQFTALLALPFQKGNDLSKYFELLPDESVVKTEYLEMLAMTDDSARTAAQDKLRSQIMPGSIDVNIMSKLDKQNYSGSGAELPAEYCDAMSALRGYALSSLDSSIVFSAGYNPRLYSYAESFPDFFPDSSGKIKKKIILKVSDFRSAMIQARFFAKKGLFVSEFRVESGLNCGGHAFPTEGFLLGPILEEFKEKRAALNEELLITCNQVWKEKGITAEPLHLEVCVSAQGGIGTAAENDFLLKYYEIDSTGWGSPFLLVPEATNVDDETLQQLSKAQKSDYYLSYASPLGIPFNNFRPSSSEKQRRERIAKGRPGSPCYKKFLSSDTEFTEKPICVASREYQHLKLKQLLEQKPDPAVYKKEYEKITEKDCLCEGLGTAALLKNNIPLPHKLKAVTICPGPNLAYFSRIATLREMVDHIYGRITISNQVKRPNIFVNELMLYIQYLKKEVSNSPSISLRQVKYFQKFKSNLLEGIEYYKSKLPVIIFETEVQISEMIDDLKEMRQHLESLIIPQMQPVAD